MKTLKTEKRQFAAFDIDGTLFRWQLFHDFMFTLKDRGVLDEQSTRAIDEDFLQWSSRKIPFAKYEETIVQAFRDNIGELSAEDYEKIARETFKKSSHKIYTFTQNYMAELKKQGYFLLAITGSLQEIAEPFAELYGFDDCIGSILELDNGKFTGHTSRKVVGRKDEIIREYIKANNLTLKGSVAVGDSEGDISMLALVEKPLAFNPTHELMTVATENGWDIVIERKNVAYRLERGSDGTYLLAQTNHL